LLSMIKILLIFFVLFFTSLVFADDISDFEIEGISIGDSLLDYFSETEIKNQTQYIYEEDGTKEIAVIFYYTNLKIYDAVQLDFKTEDPQLTIVGIYGNIVYSDNMEECYEKKDQIVKEISSIFKEADKESSSGNHPGYPDGKVKFIRTSFFINENERSNLEIVCFDIAEEMNMKDRLGIDFKSKEYNDWLVEFYE